MPAVSPFGVLLFAAQAGVGALVSRSLAARDRARRAALGLGVALLGVLVLLRFGVVAALAVDVVALAASVSVADRAGARAARGR